ncbi:Putative peptidoglycan binding domain-containing protein [Sulfitobacter brevis]|uniref:Putative peptidoglycan binding domain-containing protein n=1 Tax=Sulfitobacter brevis TaxID=74348 RepID=A0A1I1Z1I3_9RHOB|nr:peptidoglycan-binding domain-containing protein [Sulfitobacter brevis]SFE25589.1 Putative peptidoglycan binding domain-containing protein [Sulfitobacter brevis]
MTQAPLSRPTASAPLWLGLSLGLSLVLAGCGDTTQGDKAERPEPGVYEPTRNGPHGAAEGSCWGKTVSPAVIESVTEQVQISPAKVNADGTIAKPPVYNTETRQQIVRQRVENWFETPCNEVLTVEFVETLQRALQARGLYAGAVNGEMDAATRAAVQKLQRSDGPDSGVLSLETARELGLIAVPRSTL